MSLGFVKLLTSSTLLGLTFFCSMHYKGMFYQIVCALKSIVAYVPKIWTSTQARLVQIMEMDLNQNLLNRNNTTPNQLNIESDNTKSHPKHEQTSQFLSNISFTNNEQNSNALSVYPR